MSFIADKQTLDDLNIHGKFKQHSIFSLFNKVKTGGGERLLDELFRNPLTDVAAINQRSSLFHHFQQLQLTLPFQQNSFRVAENYLGSPAAGNYLFNTVSLLRKKFTAAVMRDEQWQVVRGGLIAGMEALKQLKTLLNKLDIALVHDAKIILAGSRLTALLQQKDISTLPVLTIARYDWLLRYTLRHEMDLLLQCIYQLDVYIAVSDVARNCSFSYAKALPADRHCIHATAIRHPGLERAVANPLSLQPGSNMLFLTGANMAGKSTFMKSFGIAVYLAHMGFPVAAGEMEFSVLHGLYSSINVPDNLALGYSHFYAEVLRVKQVAETVSSGKNTLVIFDELFKGTNVKDAYDATLAVTAALAQYHNCLFIISTHIIEAGDVLRVDYRNIQFGYMPTVMKGTLPVYTYRLTEGITSDRHGMIIIENEKILDLINA